jgi:hypothetical protein
MADETPELSLKQLISAVSDELLASQQERVLAGRPALFELGEVALEVSFVVTHSKSGGGGFTFHVIKADGNIKYDTESVQKATIKLTPLKTQLPDGTFGPMRLSLDDDTRP